MQRTPAQLFALVIGAVLVIAGIIGFFYNASFATGDDAPRAAVLGILAGHAHVTSVSAEGLRGIGLLPSLMAVRRSLTGGRRPGG